MKDYYVNLNSLPVRLAVSFVIDDITKVEILVKDIKFGCTKTKHGLWIKKKFVFCYDRHLHWPRKNQHTYAIHEFLKAVEETCPNYAPITAQTKAKKQNSQKVTKRKVVGSSYQRVLVALKTGPIARKTPLIPKKTRSKKNGAKNA